MNIRGMIPRSSTELTEAVPIDVIVLYGVNTTFTNFSMEYHLMCKVYTDVGDIK